MKAKNLRGFLGANPVRISCENFYIVKDFLCKNETSSRSWELAILKQFIFRLTTP